MEGSLAAKIIVSIIIVAVLIAIGISIFLIIWVSEATSNDEYICGARSRIPSSLLNTQTLGTHLSDFLAEYSIIDPPLNNSKLSVMTRSEENGLMGAGIFNDNSKTFDFTTLILQPSSDQNIKSYSVSLDGSILSITELVTLFRVIKVYRRQQSFTYLQIHEDMNNYEGALTSVSGNGEHLATCSLSLSGYHLKVFEVQNDTVVLVGTAEFPTPEDDKYIDTLSISPDGDVVILTIYKRETPDSNYVVSCLVSEKNTSSIDWGFSQNFLVTEMFEIPPQGQENHAFVMNDNIIGVLAYIYSCEKSNEKLNPYSMGAVFC